MVDHSLESTGPEGLNGVNANVDVLMATADEQIRVSERVKRELDRRRRAGESYNDVLERVLEEERDLLAGFGAFKGTDRGEAMREMHERGKEQSRERIEAMAQRRSDE